MTIVREIPFKIRTFNSPEGATAEYVDRKIADEVLGDVAAICNAFSVPMVVEGHTKGGESEFWQELAENRARLIIDSLTRKGVPRKYMLPIGLPGKKGLNKVGIAIKLDIFPDDD